MSAIIKWIPTNAQDAENVVSNRAVIGGHEIDGSPLWVIRAHVQGNLIPGKLAVKRKQAYVTLNGKEVVVDKIEVCAAHPDKIHWVTSDHSGIPPTEVVVGGYTSSGETLYVGRAEHNGSVIPGAVHPNEKGVHVAFDGKAIILKNFEYLCTV